ncbi:hypothetical protein BJ165DRAFT_758284 [Panaeolus papilionaceus]|nr:hypothetical protein BJ165DRAFT_758284 [Panaeolus papilionaceus]
MNMIPSLIISKLISTLFLVFIAVRIYVSLANAIQSLARSWGLGYRDTVHVTSARSSGGAVDDRSSAKKERKQSQSRIPSIDIACSDNLQKATKPIAASASQPSPTSTPEAESQNGIGHTTPHDCVPPLPTHCCCHSHMCVPHTSNASTNGNHRDAIHLQICIDNSRTLITGSNFRSVVGVSAAGADESSDS